MHRIQAASGIAFAFFLSLHLATTASAAFGPAGYDRMLEGTRTLYRPLLVVEAALVAAPALVHIACAIAQIRRRRRAGVGPRPPLAVRLHRSSGMVLMLAITGHVIATRVLVHADFSFIAFAMLRWPGFFVPYYLLLGASGATHLMLGLGFGLARLAPSTAAFARRPARLAAAAAAIVATVGVASIIVFAPRADRGRFAEFEALLSRLTSATSGTHASARP